MVMITGAGRAAGGFTIVIGCDLRETDIRSKIRDLVCFSCYLGVNVLGVRCWSGCLHSHR